MVERHPYKVDVISSSLIATTITLGAAVVQLVRMPPCHGGGRGFEPRPLRHLLNLRLRLRLIKHPLLSVKLNFKIISSKITLYDLLLIFNLASLAQLVEHITLNDGVVGSRPTRGTIFWPIRLAVRTPASHVGNTSSSLVWVTIS